MEAVIFLTGLGAVSTFREEHILAAQTGSKKGAEKPSLHGRGEMYWI
jgi:hypothetical protein